MGLSPRRPRRPRRTSSPPSTASTPPPPPRASTNWWPTGCSTRDEESGCSSPPRSRTAAQASAQRVRRPVPAPPDGRGAQARDFHSRGHRHAPVLGGSPTTVATANAAASLRDVTMRCREHVALDAVSTEIECDAITGLLGRNGAGKTTLMQLARRPPRADQRQRRGLRTASLRERFDAAPDLLHQGGPALPRPLPGARRTGFGGSGLLAVGLRPRGLPPGRLRPAGEAADQEALARHELRRPGSSSDWPPAPRSPSATSRTWAWTRSRGSSSTTGCWPTTQRTRGPSSSSPI